MTMILLEETMYPHLNLSTNLPGLFRTVENIDFSYFIDAANVWGVDYSRNN